MADPRPPADPSVSNTRAPARELLDEGLRLEKAGLAAKALSRYQEAREWTDDPSELAESWLLESHARHALCAWDEAISAARQSAEAAGAARRDDLVAEALNAEAAVHFARGELDDALQLYRRMLSLAGPPRIRGLALQNMATILANRGELEEAAARFGEAYDAFDAAGYDWGKAHVMNNRVALALDEGQFDVAEREGRRAVQLARKMDDLDLISVATLNLAEAHMGLNDLESAEREASQALGQFNTSGNAWRRAICLRILGDIAGRQGDREVAERMWTMGLEIAREIGTGVEISDFERRLQT